jgi:hypothetical protein
MTYMEFDCGGKFEVVSYMGIIRLVMDICDFLWIKTKFCRSFLYE